MISSTETENSSIVELTVPPSVPELTLLCISDTHDQQAYIPAELPHADILVHAGDFTCRGSRDEIQNFQRWTQQLLDEGVVREVVFVCGNHEPSMQCLAKIPAARAAQEALKQNLTCRDHVHYLEDSGCEVAGLRFYGSPWTVRCGRDWAFQALDNDEPGFGLAGKYETMTEQIDVLITHQPPYGQGDTGNGTRVGSRMLAAKVAAVKPLVHIFGHIHTGHGVTANEETLFVNAAVCDEDYQPVQKPIVVRLVHHKDS